MGYLYIAPSRMVKCPAKGRGYVNAFYWIGKIQNTVE